MDLVYTNSRLEEIGVLDCIQLDYDCNGSKDFEITMCEKDANLEDGSLWYIEGEEYVGIIDGSESIHSDSEVTYIGINTRGILDKKILELKKSIIYHSGNVSEIIQDWINVCDLTDLFIVDQSDYEVINAPIRNHITLYEGIINLLSFNECIPTFEAHAGHILIKILPIQNFGDSIQYSGANANRFVFKKRKNPVNHMICTALDESGESYTIHLFSDDFGTIQPYKIKDIPLEDEDYILDTSNRVISGIYERVICEKFDLDIIENYKILSIGREEWKRDYKDYYVQVENEDDDVTYDPVEPVERIFFVETTKKPQNWEKNYTNYYVHTGSTTSEDDYSEVSAEQVNTYSLLTKQPWDWITSWSNYYQNNTTGTGPDYTSVEGIKYDTYALQTNKPYDWDKNWRAYFQNGYEYKKNDQKKAPSFKKNKFYKKNKNGTYSLISKSPSKWSSCYKNYYTKSSKTYKVQISRTDKAPKWTKNKYYTKIEKEKAPQWSANKYYFVSDTKTTLPEWIPNKYYFKLVTEEAPEWIPNKYYYKVLDHYGSMVADAIEKMKEYVSSNTAGFQINDADVRIGDVVVCRDEKTGKEFNESVTNIIYKIQDGIETFDYVVGGEM